MSFDDQNWLARTAAYAGITGAVAGIICAIPVVATMLAPVERQAPQQNLPVATGDIIPPSRWPTEQSATFDLETLVEDRPAEDLIGGPPDYLEDLADSDTGGGVVRQPSGSSAPNNPPTRPRTNEMVLRRRSVTLAVEPVWRTLPTAATFATAYPEAAQRQQRQGRVVLGCYVTPAGPLDCTVDDASTSRYGFIEAALRLASQYEMEPYYADGVASAGSHCLLIFRFRLSGGNRMAPSTINCTISGYVEDY